MPKYQAGFKSILLICFSVLLSLWAIPAQCGEKHSVLVLHSYHKADWTDSLMEGIIHVLGPRRDVLLRIEYMDTKTVYTPEYLDQLADIYGSKYSPDTFDLILTTDDNALRFALDRRDRLFPGVPVVFCGVNKYDPEIRDRPGHVTGVLEKGDFAATLRVAGSMFTSTATVYVICDRTRTGEVNLQNFMLELKQTFPDNEVVILQDYSYQELLERLTSPGLNGGFAFFISFWKDREGRQVSPADLEQIFRQSTIPVFGRSEWMVGRGSVGGMCVHGFSQGEAAAFLGGKILDGHSPSTLPVIINSPNKYIFDYKELKRHGLELEKLPKNHLLINAPKPYYELYKTEAYTLLLSFSVGLVLILGLTWGIRKQRKSERKLRESEQLYRTLVDNVDLGITLINRDFKIVMTNEAQCSFFDKTMGYFNGRVCYKEFENRSEVCSRCPGRKAMELGTKETVKKYFVLENGEKIYMRILAFPVRDDGGDVSGFIEVVEDITAQKKADEEKKLLEEKVRETQKLESLGVLAGGIAHDFNNLLVGILGNTDLALMKMSPESSAREFVMRTALAAERAADLANQMLAYSGKGHFIKKRLGLNVLVEEMAHLLKAAISKKATLHVKCNEELPQVEGDPTQLRQVVMNLITNASDALGDNEGSITLRTGTMEVDDVYLKRLPAYGSLAPGRYCYIEVEDSGGGMDEATLDRIFEPFYTTKETGRGLGLAAAQGIVRGHNGAINVYSEPGKGTTVKVLIPVVETVLEREREEVHPVEEEYPDTHEGLILLVDDNQAVREVARVLLEQMGYKVIEAVDGQEAVDLYAEHKDMISLVLLDMTMPRKNGQEAFSEMHAINPKVRVVLSSGYTEQETVKNFTGKGLAGFLQKPYRGKQLRDTVKRILG